MLEFRNMRGRRLDSKEGSFIALELAVLDTGSLEESIRCLCAPETLSGENRFFDTRSGRRIRARIAMSFVEVPQILVCHLRRFEFDQYA
jgi:ubiquitin C-terminal hydrolase